MEYTVWIEEVRRLYSIKLGHDRFDEDAWMEDYLDEKTPQQTVDDEYGD